jgi:WD40 repeat protein
MISRLPLLLICLIFLSPPFIAEGQFLEDTYVSWSPDGRVLAVGVGSTLQIVDVATMQVVNTLTDLQQQATEAAWSPDGTRLAIADGTDVEVWEQPWDAENGQLSLTYQYYADRNPPVGRSYVESVAWDLSSTRIASGFGERIDIWDAQTGERIFRFEFGGYMWDLDWNANGILASGGAFHGTVTVWNLDLGEAIRNLLLTANAVIPEDRPTTRTIAWSHDDSYIAIGVEDGTVRIWDASMDDVWARLSEYDRGVMRGHHTEPVLSVDWSPDGQFIASGSQDGTLRLWDAATGDQLAMIEPIGTVTSVAFSPDGSRLAFGQGIGMFQVVEIAELLSST